MRFSLLTWSLPLAVFSAHADRVLILSGGGSPAGNHYSQYLQTKTLTDELRTMIPQTEVSVLFGAGNALGAQPVLADVHRVHKDGELSREELIPGFIEGNAAATHANVARYFDSGRSAAMTPDETFFLIVSDHGMPFVKEDGRYDRSYENNCIDLWGFEADLAKEQFSAAKSRERCFSRRQLRDQLDRHVSAGRSVFAMSQCFSGGFHRLSVDLSGDYPKADPKVCGFTAITEDTTASGCTPDVDGPGYQGYERSFTEQLTGVDVVTGRRLRPARYSFMNAHRAAAIEDIAKDIPLATSDFYLWKWAQKIREVDFVPRSFDASPSAARLALEASAVGRGAVLNQAYRSKEEFFRRMEIRLLRLHPEHSREVLGSIARHRALEAQLAAELAASEKAVDDKNEFFEKDKHELLKRWNAFVKGGQSSLSAKESSLETELFGRFDEEHGAGGGSWTALFVMSMKSVTDPAAALAIGEYKAKRYATALDWALRSGQTELVDLAFRLQKLEAELTPMGDAFFELEKRHGHIRRLLIYREALGAWDALEVLQDRQALTELAGLIECESTRLPQ